MRLFEIVSRSVRLVTAFILVAASASAWAQQAYDAGIPFEYGSNLEELPRTTRAFDFGLSPTISGGILDDDFDGGLGGPASRDRVWFFFNPDLPHNNPPRNNQEDPDLELGLDLEYSFHNGIDLPIRYTHEPSAPETVPSPERLAPEPIDPRLDIGWDVHSPGGLFGQWQEQPREEPAPEFTMGPNPIDDLGSFLLPGDEPEEDGDSFYVNPPTIETIDNGLTLDIGYRFEDEFAVQIPYGEVPPEPLLPEELRGFSVPIVRIDGPLVPRDIEQEASDARVAATRRFIEDGRRIDFYDALHAHADGTGSIEAVEEAREALRSRND